MRDKLGFIPGVSSLLIGLFLMGVALLLLAGACAGEQGIQGPQGERGLQGEQGVAGPPGASTGIISGVITAAGKPLEKASLSTVPAGGKATTDASGKYEMKDLPVGVYTVTSSLAGYKVASQKATVLAAKTVTINLALSPATPFPLGHTRAVSFRTNDKDTYAEGKLWLTTHYAIEGKPLTHNEAIIVTSGLPNVGLGSYVYLQGKDKDAAEKKITAWEWQVVGPGESAVALENPTSQNPRFKADKIGKYEVKITAANEEGKKASSQFEVYAGTFVGAEKCIACHSGSVMPDTFSEWQQTGHATKLILTYASYTPERDYCIGCHTTGYNETDKAGGFDELAQGLGWDPSQKSLTGWLIENKWTVDGIMASALGKLANVQCEACHGPGLIHEGIINAKETGALYTPGVCSQCHPQEVQWRYSGHANTGSAEMHMAGGASCVECHTGQGFVQVKIRGLPAVFPDEATADSPATLVEPGNQPPVACAACHDPHAFPEPFNKGTADKPNIASYQLRLSGEVAMPNGVTVNAHESAVCVTCHANKRDMAYKADYLAGKKTRGAHYNTQADVFYGVTAAVFDFGGSPYSTSPHKAVVEEACIQCHMAANPVVAPGADGKLGTADDVKELSAGGHTWSMVGTYQGQPVQNVANACVKCHAGLTTYNRPAFGDYDGDGKVEGIQDEVAGLLTLVVAQLPKDSAGNVLVSGITPQNTTELQRQALWNYTIIGKDGSQGVHNAAFSVQVLQRTYKQLAGKDVPGAALR